jgi:hypothetical protein
VLGELLSLNPKPLNLALCKNLFHFITCHAATLEKHQLGFIYVIVSLHLQDLKTQIWGWGVGGRRGPISIVGL